LATARTLTAAAVARLKPGHQRLEIKGAAAPSLYLVIQPEPSGSKSWAMRFRRPDGQRAKLTLGPVDLSGQETTGEPTIGMPLSLSAARRLAADVQRQRALGRDVVADHAVARQRQRIEVEERSRSLFPAAVRIYITEGARPNTRRWRETSRNLGLNPDTLEPFRRGLCERWRDRAIGDITGIDILAITDEARRHGIPGLQRKNDGLSEPRARRFFASLSEMFGWLHRNGRIPSNPFKDAHRPSAPEARDRVLGAEEIRIFWLACDRLGPPFGPLFKLLLITGARREEVARMTAEELTGDSWSLGKTRTKNKRVHVTPLPPLALSLLEDRPPSGFVFTTNAGRSPVSGFSRTKGRLDQLMAEIAGREIASWVLHDLRRSCATGMAEIGIPPHIIEATLNHVSGVKAGVSGIYNRAQHLPERRDALEKWATCIERIVTGKTAKVVRLRGQR
jgi:integrase